MDIAPAEPAVVDELEVSVREDEQAASRLTAANAPRILLYIQKHPYETGVGSFGRAKARGPARLAPGTARGQGADGQGAGA